MHAPPAEPRPIPTIPSPAPPAVRSVHVALLAVQVLFGLWPVAGAAVLQVMSPAALIGVRTLVAAPLLCLMFRPGWTPVRRGADVLALFGLGLLGVSVNQLLFVEALDRAGPVNAAVLGVLTPAVTLGFAALLGRERLRPLRVVGLAVAMAGAMLLARPERFDLADRKLTGSLFLLASTACYSLYLVLARDVIARLGTGPTVSWVFVFGSLQALPFTLPALLETPFGALPGWAWGALAFIVLAATVATYALNGYALRRADSSLVAVYVYLQPIVSALGTWSVFGTPVPGTTLACAAVIFGGVALATVQPARLRQRWRK